MTPSQQRSLAEKLSAEAQAHAKEENAAHNVNAPTDDDGEPVDDYGNPLSGDRIINCCFPDCGCDGARLCMAENGASSCARFLNIERGTF